MIAVCLGLISMLTAVALWMGYDGVVLTSTIASICGVMSAVIGYEVGKHQKSVEPLEMVNKYEIEEIE